MRLFRRPPRDALPVVYFISEYQDDLLVKEIRYSDLEVTVSNYTGDRFSLLSDLACYQMEELL